MKRFWDDFALAAIMLAVGIAGAILIIPLVFSLTLSIEPRGYMGPFPPPGISLQWYVKFFTSEYYMRALGVSLIIALIAATISSTLGVMAAIGLSRARYRGFGIANAVFVSPLVVPGVVIGFSLLFFFSRIGVDSSAVKVVLAHVLITLPYTIRTNLAAMTGIGDSLIEAALSLGAKQGEALRKIVLPLARTGIATGFIFAFAFSLDDIAVTIFLTSPTIYTLPVALVANMKANFTLEIAAASVMLVFFALAVIVILDKIVGIETVMGKGIYRN